MGETANSVMPPAETQSEPQPWKQHMAYGSERFESATANNHNVVLFTETDQITKMVLGKDVALILPRDPDSIPMWAGYPTHQESWLPLSFVLLNHSQHRTPEELAYREKLNARITPEDRQLMRQALIYKANEFWEGYKQDTEVKEPRKKYKNITRVAQDILLYVDAPETVIQDQQKYLESHPLYPIIQCANELRKGVGLERAPELEAQVEAVLDKYVNEIGLENARQAYDTLQERLATAGETSAVIILPDKSIQDAELYADLASYDLLMAEDDHDQDVVSIVSSLDEPRFYQLDTKYGPKLAKERRRDVIAVPPTLGMWDVVKGGKESYQPISMIVTTHTVPTTAEGRQMQERLQQEMTPEMVSHHYLGAAEEFLHRDAWGKSFAKRAEGKKVTQIKKVIPLYRIACDLLPRAVYMRKTGKFSAGVPNEELWREGETLEEATKIQELFAKQDATQEELQVLFEAIESKFQKWFTEEDYLLFLENMDRMGQLVTLSNGEQLRQTVKFATELTGAVPQESQDIVRSAAALALVKHHEQTRQGGETYANHVLRVGKRAAEYVKDHPDVDAKTITTAATLHDILEDTDITYGEVVKRFGKNVADIVQAVSHLDEDEPDSEYLARVQKGGRLAVLTKRFDRLENLDDLTKAPVEFRRQKLTELQTALPIWQQMDPEGAEQIESKLQEMIRQEQM